MDLKALFAPPGAGLTKTLRILKLTAIILLSACLVTSAKGLSQKITLTAKDAPLENVIQQIKKQTGYSFFYNIDWLEKARSITVDIKNLDIEKALDIVFKNQPLSYKLINRTIVLELKKEADINEEISSLTLPLDVKGRVVNEKGEPMEGVTVSVKGTQLATATDANGQFSLRGVDSEATLVFTGVSVETIEVKVNGRNEISVNVKTKISSLSEVTVTTGYQVISKERSAGSFAKPDLEIMQNRSTSMNVLQRLDGLVAGLTVNNAPSASQNPFLIRGLSTIGILDPAGSQTYIGTNRNPLFVVDGISMDDVSSINPQDVADITVLKDATAASIWGSRASNGVIVIATKKGTNNAKIKVQYDGFITFQGKPDLNYMPVLNSQQFIQSAKEVFDPVLNPWGTVSGYLNTGSTGVPLHERILYNQYRGLISPAQATASLDSLAAINNIDQISDLWYRNAALMNHSVSISGGGKIHSFYGSLTYTNTQSNRPGEKNNLYKINVRQDFNFSNHIQMYLITDLTNTKTYSKRNVNIDNRFYPYQLFQDPNGSNLSIPYMGYLSDSIQIAYQNRSRINLDYNPLNERDYGYTKSDALMNRIVAGATIKFFKGLRFEGTYSYIKGANNTASYDDTKSYLVRSEIPQFTVAATPSATPVYYLPTNGGRYSVTNLSQRNWTVRNQLIYDNSWDGIKHQLTVLAGQEAQEQLTITNGSTVRGYNELLQTYGSIDYATLGTTGVPSPVMANNIGRSVLTNNAFNQTESQTRLTSYYANAAYTLNRKYSINGSWRIDQSNLFGIDKSAQNRPVWSVGAKWLMSDEQFLSKTSWLNRFALRATYGITGNSPSPGTASSFDILAPQTSNFLPGGVGLRIVTPGNSKLTWESTKSINIGFDFAIFKNRLSGSVDIYQKKTSDLLGELAVNSFTGYSSIIGNFGNMENKGIELNLMSNNIKTRDFAWSTLFTMAYNKNKVTQLNSVVPITTGAQKVVQRYLTGYPAFTVFAYEYAGLDNLGDPQIYLANKTITKVRNIATPNDIAYKGTYQPIWNGGLSNTFSYKQFDLAINLVYSLGHVMRRDANNFYTGRMTHNNLEFRTGNKNEEFYDRWRVPGDELITSVPSYLSNVALSGSRRDVGYYTSGDINVVSASYIKLRDITLSYGLPKDLISRIKVDDISFRLQFSNIMLWKANKYDIDPEFHDAFTGARSLRSNQGIVTFGVHVNF